MPNQEPLNPLTDGKVSYVSAVGFAVGGIVAVAVIAADTIQFVLTHHESSLLLALVRMFAGVSITGVIGLLLTYWRQSKKDSQ